MAASPRTSVPALRVHQWLPVWDEINFDASAHRRKPPKHFYVTSMSARKLRALSDIRRRSTTAKGSRQNDLGIQRRHNTERSEEISEFLEYGFPWSVLSGADRKSGQYNDLKKPGWLPTAIVVNILTDADNREGRRVAPSDLIKVDDSQKSPVSSLTLPDGFTSTWRPKQVAPIEVIDGQHRLWSFNDLEDENFELPVVAFYGLDISWQAYLFYVINIKPAKINTSLGFDLYPLLRTEDWLEHAGGPAIYRESRAQELTEALWSYPDSPWYHRIDMLGESGRRYVTQAAWIRSLLATVIKKWESTRTPVGGLFGSPAGQEEAVLPWTRSQQSAFLITAWRLLRDALANASGDWAQALRDSAIDTAQGDPAFAGPTTLLNTDQGVRAVLGVINDVCYVRADELRLRDWPPNDFAEGTSEIGISQATKSLEKQPVYEFLRSVATGLTDYDWRTYSAPGLSNAEQSAKGRFRGSTGYRELKRDVLNHLSEAGTDDASTAAADVLVQLGW